MQPYMSWHILPNLDFSAVHLKIFTLRIVQLLHLGSAREVSTVYIPPVSQLS